MNDLTEIKPSKLNETLVVSNAKALLHHPGKNCSRCKVNISFFHQNIQPNFI